MPPAPEKTWAEYKAEGRARYMEIVNAKLRAAFYERLLRHRALCGICKDPRDIRGVLLGDFPDAWSTPTRWYFDKVLRDKRAQAWAWMQSRPVSNRFVDMLLSWSNPNKEFL